MADLLDKETFKTKLKENLAIKNEMFEKLFDAEGFKFEDIFDVYFAAGQRLKEYTVDTAKVLDDAFMADEKYYSKVLKV